MTDTKERILMTALHLFARDGYEAVSVSTIAGELGMTKGALYKHYQNKRDIFDSIVQRMIEVDAERAEQYEVPQESFESEPSAYRRTTLEQLQAFSLAQFAFWTEDEFAADFRKMLILEQYRSEEMGRLYSDCLLDGPIAYVADIFREMMAVGVLHENDPQQLAMEFYAPLYLMIQRFDHTNDKERSEEMLKSHIKRFVQTYSSEKI